jgi:TonB family protein
MSLSPASLNAVAWALQSVLLLACGMALPSLLRITDPSVRLRYWRFLFLAVLLVPLLQFRFAPAPAAGGAAAPVLLGVVTLDVSAAGRPAARLPWVWILWAAGAVLFLRRAATGLLRLKRLRAAARPPRGLQVEIEWPEFRFTARPQILLSEEIRSPVTFGWRPPVILLPADFPGMGTEARRTMAAHEMLHVARRDWLWLVAEEAFRALLWFHPAVWLLLPRIDLCREQVVDQEVVRRTGERREYMHALVAMARRRQGASAVGSLPFHGRSHLLQRMALLAQEGSMSRRRLAVSALALVLSLSLAGLLAVRAFPLRAQGGDQAGAKAQQKEEKVYTPEDGVKTHLVKQVNPVYPEEAKKKGLHGKVVLEILIDERGSVAVTKIMKSADPILDAAAREAVSQWEYEPPMLQGKPVKAKWFVVINFRATGDSEEAPAKPEPKG